MVTAGEVCWCPSTPWRLICANLPAVGAYRLTVRLGREARRGWQKASRQTGCSITAILEAIGRDLDHNPDRLLERGSDLIEAARQIDLERRGRQR